MSLSAAGDGYALSASDPTDLASDIGTVTLSIPAAKAQILLPILDTLVEQLAASVGRYTQFAEAPMEVGAIFCGSIWSISHLMGVVLQGK